MVPHTKHSNLRAIQAPALPWLPAHPTYKCKQSHKKANTTGFPSDEVPRVVRIIETDSGRVGAGGAGVGVEREQSFGFTR